MRPQSQPAWAFGRLRPSLRSVDRLLRLSGGRAEETAWTRLLLCREVCRAEKQCKRDIGVRRWPFFKYEQRKNGKSADTEEFLDDLELSDGHHRTAHAIRRNLQAILKEGDAPCSENGDPERSRFELEMSVPGRIHECVGQDEQTDSLQHCGHHKSLTSRSTTATRQLSERPVAIGQHSLPKDPNNSMLLPRWVLTKR